MGVEWSGGCWYTGTCASFKTQPLPFAWKQPEMGGKEQKIKGSVWSSAEWTTCHKGWRNWFAWTEVCCGTVLAHTVACVSIQNICLWIFICHGKKQETVLWIWKHSHCVVSIGMQQYHLSLSPPLSPWLASVALTQIAYSMKYNSISCPPVWPEGVIDARKPVRHAVGNVAKIQHPHLRRFLQLRNYSPVWKKKPCSQGHSFQRKDVFLKWTLISMAAVASDHQSVF